MSYLPLFYPQLYTFFESFLIDKSSVNPAEAWLDFEGVPLRWYTSNPTSCSSISNISGTRHWPIGLLYDILTGRDPSYATMDFDSGDEHRLPWTLTVHYSEYPNEHLMRLDNPSALQDSFVNSIKEVGKATHFQMEALCFVTWRLISFNIFCRRIICATATPGR